MRESVRLPRQQPGWEPPSPIRMIHDKGLRRAGCDRKTPVRFGNQARGAKPVFTVSDHVLEFLSIWNWCGWIL